MSKVEKIQFTSPKDITSSLMWYKPFYMEDPTQVRTIKVVEEKLEALGSKRNTPGVVSKCIVLDQGRGNIAYVVMTKPGQEEDTATGVLYLDGRLDPSWLYSALKAAVYLKAFTEDEALKLYQDHAQVYEQKRIARRLPDLIKDRENGFSPDILPFIAPMLKTNKFRRAIETVQNVSAAVRRFGSDHKHVEVKEIGGKRIAYLDFTATEYEDAPASVPLLIEKLVEGSKNKRDFKNGLQFLIDTGIFTENEAIYIRNEFAKKSHQSVNTRSNYY
ncbi:MAG: hypothetical protein US50_C0055G0005 [Candidatus Nomurabacteria bacterium GW2011_GWB1_37_5]|uniref:Uncharacterized protein n=1 Tax=Candidatus Nomurabacteria bacterium GW2011_GWB1_37_5 TaxID=1618742 RepID=A0A0G0K0U8_9BACT|nr:MAG: hypothetical protein US50_C0055G0005 [Candidatus Nomurabacteria bacterium GW2011_GWB1_37_5]